MAMQHFLDPRGTQSRRRRSRLGVESLEQRVPLAADVATAIAPISMSCEPGAGSVSGEPGVVICVMPEPGVVTSIDNTAVTGGPDSGAENVMFMTTAVQRTDTAGTRPAVLVSQRLGGRPRMAPVMQQTAGPRRTNEIQTTSLPVTRPQQQAGHFSRQIAARFGRLSAAIR